MSFGIAHSVKSEVRVCTPALLSATLDAPNVAQVCSEIEDALEKCRRGEVACEEYETLKAELKKRLPIFTFHATFANGRRKNDEAIPSGLSIYDLDHIPNPREKWDSIAPRAAGLGIVLAHISPSLEGLRNKSFGLACTFFYYINTIGTCANNETAGTRFICSLYLGSLQQ